MPTLTTLSLPEEDLAAAKALVAAGAFPSLEAVVQRGLALVQEEAAGDAAFTADLRALLEERARGPRESLVEGLAAMQAMFAAKRSADAI